MGSLLFLRARDAGLEASFSRDDHASLFQFFSNALRHTLRLLDAAEELTDAFRTRGIDAVLLKGAAHVFSIYKNPGARPMADVDVLVRREAFRDSIRIARDLGYAFGGSPSPANDVSDSVSLAKGEIHVDLHERLTHRLANDPDLGPLFDRAVNFPAGGENRRTLRIFAPEDAALHAVLHIAHHGFSMRLIAFADLARLVAMPTFRSSLFAAELDRFRMAGVAYALIQRLEKNLGVSLGVNLLLDVRSSLIARALPRLLDNETMRLKFEVPDKWRYALIVRPLLDGLGPTARFLIGRATSRWVRSRHRD